MADTLNNVVIPNNEWVNLNTLSGLPLTTQLKIQNVGATLVILYTGSEKPTDSLAFNSISPGNDFFINELPSTGEWAKAVGADGLLNVGEKV